MDEEYKRILNMTNKEAADILKKTLFTKNVARANGKSRLECTIHVALMKAIMLLDTTPDEKEKEDGRFTAMPNMRKIPED